MELRFLWGKETISKQIYEKQNITMIIDNIQDESTEGTKRINNRSMCKLEGSFSEECR
jgi:hypothetical protein